MIDFAVPVSSGPLGVAAALGTAVAPGLARAARCGCGETLSPRGQCLNVGDCRTADRDASRQSNRRGAAQSAPRAWTISGGVD